MDALVVSSGVCPFDDWMAQDWDEVFERTNAFNVGGAVNCVRAALPRMVARGQGRIVLVGSVAARASGLLSGPHYVASKGGVRGSPLDLPERSRHKMISDSLFNNY